MNKGLIACIILTICLIPTYTLAINPSEYEPKTLTDYSGFTSIAEKIVGVLQYIGILVAVVVIAIIGIKYMMGSVAEKAEYKKTMFPLLVGCLLLMCATPIVGLIKNIAKEDSLTVTVGKGQEEAEEYLDLQGTNFYQIAKKMFESYKEYVIEMKKENFDSAYSYWNYGQTLYRKLQKEYIKTKQYKDLLDEHNAWMKQNFDKDSEYYKAYEQYVKTQKGDV